MVDSRNKGSSGEREVCKILEDITGQKVVRSLESVRAGGADIVCIPEISVEVKRYRKITDSNRWSFWGQAVSQAEKEKKRPVLFMRADRGDWEVVVALGDILGYTEQDNYYLQVRIDAYSFAEVYKRWVDGKN